MLKKFTAVLLSAFIVVLSIPFIKSNATDVTVEGTFGDVIYNYSYENLISENNYDNYFTVDSSDEYLKYCIGYGAYTNNDTAEFGYNWEDIVKYDLDSNNSYLKSQVGFYDHTGYKCLVFWYNPNGAYSRSLQTFVIEPEDANAKLFTVNGRLVCTSQFTLYYRQYYLTFDNSGYISGVVPYSSGFEGSLQGSYTGSAGGYYYFQSDLRRQFLYSEIPFYNSYVQNTNYPLGNYLGESPYNYNNFENIISAVVNGTDTTGFVVDRRSEFMINGGSGGGDNPTIDSNLGVIGGSFDCLLSADSLNNQKFLVVYDLNDYTKQIKNTINLKLNYQFFCDGQYQNNEFTFDGNFVDSVGYPDSYNVNYSNYVTIDINKVFNNIYGSDLIAGDFGLDTIFMLGNQVNFNQNFYTANEFINSIMKIGGFSLSTKKNVDYYNKRSFWDNVADTVIDYLNYGFTEKSLQFNYNTSKETVFNDCYLLVTMYLENEQNNTCSDSYIYKYNYLDGTVSDVGGFADDSVFSGNYPTTNSGSASYPSNNTGYGGSAYGGSGGSASASTGDIYVYPGMTSLPYLLVDIPEDEWINKTPNLKTIFTDFKDALSEIKDDSILNVMSETYNYIPVPMWQYLTYGVSILLAIGIWRGITRR